LGDEGLLVLVDESEPPVAVWTSGPHGLKALFENVKAGATHLAERAAYYSSAAYTESKAKSAEILEKVRKIFFFHRSSSSLFFSLLLSSSLLFSLILSSSLFFSLLLSSSLFFSLLLSSSLFFSLLSFSLFFRSLLPSRKKSSLLFYRPRCTERPRTQR
jgi:hypothetical protein